MFPFTEVLPANDRSVKGLIWLAEALGCEGADWVWEWRDGGRAAFSFKNLDHLEAFRVQRILVGGDGLISLGDTNARGQ
jgi:hypothetical protein